MNITVLGTGAYGIALAKMFSKNNCNVMMWTKVSEEYQMLNSKRCNEKVLPGYYIDEKIQFTMDMEEALSKARIIVVAIPVKFIRDTITQMRKYYKKKQYICIASKGVEQDNYLFPYIIVSKILRTKKIGVISGGTFAIDMINDVPMGLMVASKNVQTSEIIKRNLENDTLKVNISKDVLGIEFWGSIKNIIAIGCGIIDGMKLPESTRSMFFTKCFNDVMNLVYVLGGNKNSALTYAGIGDLFLTCTSLKSRNYTFGKMIGEKTDKVAINKYINDTTIEGLYTLKAFYEMIHKKKKKALIIDTIYGIVYKDMDPEMIIIYLKK